MRRVLLVLALAAGPPLPAHAMSVTAFLGKADGLYAKGLAALFSPDIGVLRAEGIAATRQWAAQAHAPTACPPNGKLALTQNEFMAMVRAVPAEKRATTSVADAIVPALNRRYPCR